VSLINTNRTDDGMATLGARAKDAAAQAIPAGKRAGTTAVQGVRQGVQGASDWAAPRLEGAVLSAREWVEPRLEDAVYGARGWAAPRLEDAADTVTDTVAPAVSSALRSAARQVRPEEPKRTGIRSLLNWRILIGVGAAAAVAGAGAAIAMRRRYASATAEAKDATELSEGDQDTPATGTPSDAAIRSEVNGRVTMPGNVTEGG
jgi:hypothetical protein